MSNMPLVIVFKLTASSDLVAAIGVPTQHKMFQQHCSNVAIPRSTAAPEKRFKSAIESAPPKTAVSFAFFLQMNNLMDFYS